MLEDVYRQKGGSIKSNDIIEDLDNDKISDNLNKHINNEQKEKIEEFKKDKEVCLFRQIIYKMINTEDIGHPSKSYFYNNREYKDTEIRKISEKNKLGRLIDFTKKRKDNNKEKKKMDIYGEFL